MDIESLQKFGLTRVESKIYLELLELKESLVGPIIKKTGLHRGTVYNSLNNLIRKGFVSTINTKKGAFYSLNKQIFKELISQKSNFINEIKLISNEISKILESPPKKKKGSEVKVLIGDIGFKSFFKDLYEWSKQTRREYLFMGRGQEMINHFGEPYYRATQELKKKLGIKCRVILNEVARKEPVSKIAKGNIRYIPWEHTSIISTWLYDNKVVVVLWEAKPIITVIIKSKEAYKSYASFFERLWKTAFAPKKVLKSGQEVKIL